jgi:acetyl esterase
VDTRTDEVAREQVLAAMAAETAALVRRVFPYSRDQTEALDPDLVRRGVRYIGRLMGQPEAVAASFDLHAGAVPIRAYVPRAPLDDVPPVAIYAHGGGWVGGDVEAADAFARALANRTGCVVASVEYRRAPEHAFPAALDDCLSALDWVTDHAASLGGDAARVALVGDSSGATLMAAVAAVAHDDGRPAPRMQVLLYPALMPHVDTDTHRAYGALSLGLLSCDMHRFWRGYAGRADFADWRLCPASYAQLAGFPPTVLVTAEFDPLRAEGEAFGERLASAGVAVSGWRALGMIHGYLWMAERLSQARTDLELIGALVRAQLAQTATD